MARTRLKLTGREIAAVERSPYRTRDDALSMAALLARQDGIPRTAEKPLPDYYGWAIVRIPPTGEGAEGEETKA